MFIPLPLSPRLSLSHSVAVPLCPSAQVATSSIPRQIPPQQWYFSSWLVYTVGGVLPFGAVFVELYFILASVWLDQYYYVFGFLFLVFLLLAITCAEIAIVLIYFQLCSEDYRCGSD